MLRVGSDVVHVGPAASHPDARPVSPADEISRIAPLLDALSDQMHRVSIDSFQPETQRYALKRGVGYLNDIQGFPDPALYPDIAEADCRLVVMHSAQRDGIATRTGHLRPEDALDEIVRFFEARVSALPVSYTHLDVYKRQHRQIKYRNNVIECDHGKLKRIIGATLGFKSMKTAYATIKGIEVMRALGSGLITKT